VRPRRLKFLRRNNSSSGERKTRTWNGTRGLPGRAAFSPSYRGDEEFALFQSLVLPRSSLIFHRPALLPLPSLAQDCRPSDAALRHPQRSEGDKEKGRENGRHSSDHERRMTRGHCDFPDG